MSSALMPIRYSASRSAWPAVVPGGTAETQVIGHRGLDFRQREASPE